VKIGFKFQSLGKISNISTADPPVLLGQFQHCFKAHWCHKGTAMKHPVPDQVKPSFVIFDIRTLWCSGLSVRVPGCQKLQMTA